MRFLLTLFAWFGLGASAFAAAEADLLVAYDNSYTDSVGGDENAKVLTANAVAASNWINESSGSPARMRICAYHKTWWQGGRSTLGGYVNWLWNYGDGELDDVTAAADAAGADLVAYICEPAAGETSAAVAHQPGRYAAYGPANFWNNVVAHESGGHNYGLDHRVGRVDPKTIMLHNYCGGGSQGFYSNPNLWLNGVKLLGEGSCVGTALQGGDAAYHLSTTAQGVADSWPRVVWGSNLYPIVHRWQFNQAAGPAVAGTTVASDVGGALATVRGQGATFTGSGLRLPGGTNGDMPADSIAAYLDLPNGIFSSMPNFTIEIWATPLSANNWMRVIEFGRTTESGDGLGAAGEYTGLPGSAAPGATGASDVIGLSACTWTGSLNDQRLVAGLDGSMQEADSTLGTTAGEMHHYAITFTDTTGSGSGGTVKWFRDGALVRSLDVGFDASEMEDVNVWLGRSNWSGDQMAHMDYHDVRIQSVALEDGQVAANYRIGPHDAVSTMWASDAFGNSGFISGAWEFGGTPVGSRDYEVGTLTLRTPANSSNNTFPGGSLRITGGTLVLKGNAVTTTTVNDLRMAGGTILNATGGNIAQTVGGSITAENFTENHVRAQNGPITISADITGGVGGGGVLYTGNAVTLTGDNAGYLGATLIGDGRFSTLKISNETQLGGNPTYYGGAWLQLNRGILETTQTMTIDDPNRGIMIQPSAGFFRPAGGTTLTIAVPINSPAAGNTLQTSPMDSNPISGMFFKDGGGTLVLTSPNNSHNGEMQILDGVMRIDGAGRINNGDHWMPITLNSTLSCNSTNDQILRGAISGSGTLLKDNSGTLHINGSNPFSGSVTVNSGTLHADPGNAATNRAFSFVSGITVNGGTLRAGPNALFGWDGTQAKPITVNTGGTLTTDAGGTDVNVGTVTLNGGTLAGGPSTAWGSWNFKRVAGAKLRVTADSSVTASNVGLGAGNAIDIDAGRTLSFDGTITDLSNEGVCALVKNGGSGTLILSGTNTYTGETSLETGTTLVNGSLGNTAVTVASAATLGGTGTIAGPVTIDGTHRPGASAGAQAFGSSIDYGAGARVEWELVANSTDPASFDRITATGAVTISAGAVVDVVLDATGSTVALDEEFWTQPRQWTFLTAGSISGSFQLGSVGDDPGGHTLSDYGVLSLVHDAVSVTLSFVPYTPHELWLQLHFGEDWDNPLVAGDDIDGDKDGVVNLLERAFGGDPNVAEHDLLPGIADGEALLSIDYRKAVDAADLVFVIKESTSLSPPWNPASGTDVLLETVDGVEKRRFTRPPGGEERLFLRVEVTRP